MNNFKRIKIRTAPPRKPLSQKAKQNLITAAAIIFIFVGVYYIGTQMLASFNNGQFVGFIAKTLGSDLKTDSKNHTNILVLGVGGEGHEGANLTDTIIVASLDHTTKRISLISIPRDLYITSSIGGKRINEIYGDGKARWGSEQSLEFIRSTIEQKLSIEIPYFVKVDFEAFVQIVDSVGGVDVYVEHAINDPMYPKGETYEYETFSLPAGLQHLDGTTALKYARSRKTSSDFDRSKRQQELLMSLKKAAASQNIFGKGRVIEELYYSLKDHVETNLSIQEILSLAGFAGELDSKNVKTTTINDDPLQQGGFLYTPLRELYGGAFVLLPAGDNFEQVNKFIQIFFYGPKNIPDMRLTVLNCTKINGLAGKVSEILTRFGANITKVANAADKTCQQSSWYARSPDYHERAAIFSSLFSGNITDVFPDKYLQDISYSDFDAILELGTSAKEEFANRDVFRNIVELVPAKN